METVGELRTLIRTKIFGIRISTRRDIRINTWFVDWTLKVQLSKNTSKSCRRHKKIK